MWDFPWDLSPTRAALLSMRQMLGSFKATKGTGALCSLCSYLPRDLFMALLCVRCFTVYSFSKLNFCISPQWAHLTAVERIGNPLHTGIWAQSSLFHISPFPRSCSSWEAKCVMSDFQYKLWLPGHSEFLEKSSCFPVSLLTGHANDTQHYDLASQRNGSLACQLCY